MRRAAPTRARLLRAALAPIDSARAAWESTTFDLDAPEGSDVQPILGWRIGELDPDSQLAPRLRGALRRTVAVNAVTLERAAVAPGSFVMGRLATVAQYAPSTGLVELVAADLAEVRPARGGDALPGRLLDVDVFVPSPAVQFVDALVRGRAVDAAYAAAHPKMDWDAVGREAVRRRRRRAVSCGAVLLDEILGPGLIPVADLTASRVIGLIERTRRLAPI